MSLLRLANWLIRLIVWPLSPDRVAFKYLELVAARRFGRIGFVRRELNALLGVNQIMNVAHGSVFMRGAFARLYTVAAL